MKRINPASSAILLLTSLYASTASADLNAAKGCTEDHAYKNMDSNKDGQVSRSEFMKFQEQRFDKMKQKDGMLSVDKQEKDANSNSMNQKAIGTTSENPNVNDRDAVNGSKY